MYVPTFLFWFPDLSILEVKVPVGKHCGFVQFVHKGHAERAIERMQGFPIGGSRIRLSWGRSQCKHLCVCTFFHICSLYSPLR